MGTGNPNPRLIEAEQRKLDRDMNEFRMALLNMLTPNKNFYPDNAATKAIVAIAEANQETKRICRMNRLRDLRRLPVGHPDRKHWYKTGDGRIDAINKKPPRHFSLGGKGDVNLNVPFELRLSKSKGLNIASHTRKKYTYI